MLCWSSSTLACNVAEACLYSSNSLYAAKDDARENPKRKPITLAGNENISSSRRYHGMGAHPPRIPPTGFLGLGGTPTCAGASSRSTALDDSSRFCVVRVACRAIKVQLRVEAITRTLCGSPPWTTLSRLLLLVIVSQHVQYPLDATNILPLAPDLEMPSKRALPSEGPSRQNKRPKFTKTRSIVVQESGPPSKPNGTTGQ